MFMCGPRAKDDHSASGRRARLKGLEGAETPEQLSDSPTWSINGGASVYSCLVAARFRSPWPTVPHGVPDLLLGASRATRADTAERILCETVTVAAIHPMVQQKQFFCWE